MSGHWRVFKAVAAKKTGDLKGLFAGKKRQESVDRDLPLGLHIGSKITLDETAFLLHGMDFKFDFPGKEQLVRAYGRIELSGPVAHRFYLESETEAQSLLELVTDAQGNLEETRLFSSLDTVYPQDAEEWDFWLNPSDGSIGLSCFETKDGTAYDRAWGEGEPPYEPPVEFGETVYLDCHGETRTEVKHAAMLYGRWISEADDLAEYTLLSAEEHADGACVQILVGIDFNPMGITLIY